MALWLGAQTHQVSHTVPRRARQARSLYSTERRAVSCRSVAMFALSCCVSGTSYRLSRRGSDAKHAAQPEPVREAFWWLGANLTSSRWTPSDTSGLGFQLVLCPPHHACPHFLAYPFRGISQSTRAVRRCIIFVPAFHGLFLQRS